MPIITAYPDVPRAYVRVEVSWADVPSVEYAKVIRVDVETGECTELRPYICFDGNYLLLSCGFGLFWDTEVPLDRQFYYITEGLGAPCLSTGGVYDTYTRTVAAGGWGNATPTGQAWSVSGGPATDYLVNGTQGIHSISGVNVGHRADVVFSAADQELSGIAIPGQVATGNTMHIALMGRFQGSGDFYMGEAQFDTAGTVTARVRRSVGGVFATLQSTATGLTYNATSRIGLRFTVQGSSLSLYVWDDALSPSPTPIITATDTMLTGNGGAGWRTILAAGNTNPLPVVLAMDDFLAVGGCQPCQPITADTSATPTIMPSNGAFRLRDPVRPCHDIYMPLCFEQVASPECLPGSGVFFASMDGEQYDANGILLNPTNARRPILVNRQRRDTASTLTVVTRTFADRDAVLLLNEPGSPVMIAGPPQYGIDDQYMAVATVSVERGLSNHKYPVRVIDMPYVSVDRPAGPMNGPCGSRVEDVCDIYPTWDDLAAAGLSWADLIRGRASQDSGSAIAALRTWDDVQAEFADWDAVEANGTWQQLAAGD